MSSLDHPFETKGSVQTYKGLRKVKCKMYFLTSHWTFVSLNTDFILAGITARNTLDLRVNLGYFPVGRGREFPKIKVNLFPETVDIWPVLPE